MVKIFVLTGLPSSGKSHYAKELAAKENAAIISSDELRGQLYGDVNDQTHNVELFQTLHRMARELLSEGKNVVVDATNINYKKRMNFLQSLNKIPCEKICILMATPYEVCLERNAQRERKVPEEVIKRMYLSWASPWYYEGWDDIEVVYSEGSEDSKGWARDWIETVKDFNQDNPHHKLTLGEHCWKTVQYINDITPAYHTTYNELRYAAMLHDEGKIFTKDFHNGKGEVSEVAHYFGHNSVSAYNSLFYEMTAEHLYVAQLIQWHMMPYLAWEQSEKSLIRDRKLLGEQLFKDVQLLHTADVYSK